MRFGTRKVWLAAIATSIILLALIVAQIDWRVMQRLAHEFDRAWLACGVGLLLLEGLITASRFRLLSTNAATLGQCLRTTAWYVLFLICMPARLGEVVGVALVVKHMGERPGVAAASILFQRVFDLIVLVALLAGAVLLLLSRDQMSVAIAAIAVVGGSLISVIFFLEQIFAQLAKPLLPRRRAKWPRRILRLLLQARTFRRHHFDRRRSIHLAASSLLKSIVNLTGISCVIIAFSPLLGFLKAYALAIVYNLAAVIPLQTIGGFGIHEAAMLASYQWLGYELSEGAPMVILIRLALIFAPLAFFAVVIASASRHAGRATL